MKVIKINIRWLKEFLVFKKKQVDCYEHGFKVVHSAIIVCIHPFLLGGGGEVEPPTKFSKRREGDLTGPQLLEGRGFAGKEGVDFIQGRGCNFQIKINHYLTAKKSTCNDKKSLWAKISFSVIIKNSNWEISTNNLVTKDKMVLRMKNFNILGVHWKIPPLWRVHEKPILRRDCLKMEAWIVCRFKMGGGGSGLGKKERVRIWKVFLNKIQ